MTIVTHSGLLWMIQSEFNLDMVKGILWAMRVCTELILNGEGAFKVMIAIWCAIRW